MKQKPGGHDPTTEVVAEVNWLNVVVSTHWKSLALKAVISVEIGEARTEAMTTIKQVLLRRMEVVIRKY